jgi:hypothetical protein
MVQRSTSNCDIHVGRLSAVFRDEIFFGPPLQSANGGLLLGETVVTGAALDPAAGSSRIVKASLYAITIGSAPRDVVHGVGRLVGDAVGLQLGSTVRLDPAVDRERPRSAFGLVLTIQNTVLHVGREPQRVTLGEGSFRVVQALDLDVPGSVEFFGAGRQQRRCCGRGGAEIELTHQRGGLLRDLALAGFRGYVDPDFFKHLLDGEIGRCQVFDQMLGEDPVSINPIRRHRTRCRGVGNQRAGGGIHAGQARRRIAEIS